MKHTAQNRITQFNNLPQCELFPLLKAAVGTPGKQGKLLAAVVSMPPLASGPAAVQPLVTGHLPFWPKRSTICPPSATFAEQISSGRPETTSSSACKPTYNCAACAAGTPCTRAPLTPPFHAPSRSLPPPVCRRKSTLLRSNKRSNPT